MLTTDSKSERPHLILLGGFLGAGKTSLILTAARILEARGMKSAAILNDQGAELVDTRLVQSAGIAADQVSGGCFCCLFSHLIDAAERVRAHSPDVIFAEAVGSCTDISATTLQPLKLYHSDKFRIAPYTVLVDPARAQELALDEADSDFVFLFNKQLEEADLVCFTKSDLYTEFPKISAVETYHVSSRTEDGVQAWLNEVTAGTLAVGSKILEIDYEHYAKAEARLAWLNCSASVELQTPLSPSLVLGPLLDSIDQTLSKEGFQIAHLKIADSSSTGFLQASIVVNGQEPDVRGNLDASPADLHDLLFNIRASGEPELLRSVVESHLLNLPGNVKVRSMQCFNPSPPKPEHRLSRVVSSSA